MRRSTSMDSASSASAASPARAPPRLPCYPPDWFHHDDALARARIHVDSYRSRRRSMDTATRFGVFANSASVTCKCLPMTWRGGTDLVGVRLRQHRFGFRVRRFRSPVCRAECRDASPGSRQNTGPRQILHVEHALRIGRHWMFSSSSVSAGCGKSVGCVRTLRAGFRYRWQ